MDFVDEVDAVDRWAAMRTALVPEVGAKKNRAEERRERKSEITPALL